jgi:hypothetical protein
MGKLLIGTSGYDYPEWKGDFTRKNLPALKLAPPVFCAVLGILYSIGKKERKNIFTTNNYE